MEASYMLGLYCEGATYNIGCDKKMINMGRNHHDYDQNIQDDEDHTNISESSSTSSSFDDNSTISKDSSSSDLLDDDASSSPKGPLYELSELMDQLPIKRGLSKYYQGKSQSFTSLARVTSLEDLAKKETPYQRKLKACKSYAGGLNNFRAYTQPKATISKKAASKGSLSNLSCLSRKGSFIGSCRPPLSPVQSSC